MRSLSKLQFLPLVFCLPSLLLCADPGPPGAWIPARWDGGPSEIARRAGDKSLADPATREAIAQWYNPATLTLLEGSPINCLLVTLSAGAAPQIEHEQLKLVKEYARAARERGFTILGLVYPGADPVNAVAAAAAAGLDGLVPDGDFPAAYMEKLEKALSAAKSSSVLIPIWTTSALARTSHGPVVAVAGVSPNARNLADMGIRGSPSSEPWIESNIWRVRSLRLKPEQRPVWISQRPDRGSAQEYARCVADAAVAGGRWIVALDDGLRAKWSRNEAGALATWQSVVTFLRFGEEHPEWRKAPPFGNLAMILDTAAPDADVVDEYLNLIARRQVAYRVIVRSQVSAAALAGFRGVFATDLVPLTAQEKQVFRDFAEKGGVVVVGPSWGDPPKEEAYEELSAGKGRVVVYKDPDPESVARDLKDLLSQDELGVVPFNVPSVITYAGAGDGGRCGFVQLLNYSNSPAAAITIRISGSLKSARLFTPESAAADLKLRSSEGKTDIFVPTLFSWAVLLWE